MIKNPIIKGSNPDPSIVRVHDDYYIATSTFEWFPGVQIHHSKDLVNWRMLTRPLNRVSQLDLRGNPSSGGIWAPNLTYSEGIFYLLYTDVKSRNSVYKDVHNYLVTAKKIEGPWSEPIYINSSGFDPALFHDDDGRKWIINMQWNFRPGTSHFDGILLQEYCPEKKSLIGPVRKIMEATGDVLEGSNLYKRNGWYYILLAEGGTGFNHSITVVSSKHIEGPYERDPAGVMLTTRHHPDHPLQKAGHGAIVETQTNEWYVAYLCSRTLPSRKDCPIGRETAIQKCEWTEDDWLRLSNGTGLPSVTEEAPHLPLHPFQPLSEKDDFERTELSPQFQTLRVPASDDWLSLTEKSGYLRLKGRESLASLHNQSMVARRIEDFHCEIETCLEFEPDHYLQMAGLICFYDERDHFYLRVSRDEILGKHLGIIEMDQGVYKERMEDHVSIEEWSRVYLKMTIHESQFQFHYSNTGEEWLPIGKTLDFGQISDEYGNKFGFSGAFAGMCAQDLSNSQKKADFDYFIYRKQSDSSPK